MNLEYLGAQDIDGYSFRTVRSDATIKIFQPKNFTEAWPGSSEISLVGSKHAFIGPLSNNNMRHLMGPGIKRYFYLQGVPMPWKIEKNVDILFAFQLEATGGIHFLVETQLEIQEALRRGFIKASQSSRKSGIILLLLFFPLSLLFWGKLVKKHATNPKILPEFSNFQAFIAKNYLKKT